MTDDYISRKEARGGIGASPLHPHEHDGRNYPPHYYSDGGCHICGLDVLRDELTREIDKRITKMQVRLSESIPAPRLEDDLTNLVVAANRMLDDWAEGDDAVKNSLWRNLHMLAGEIAERNGIFPLGNSDGPYVEWCDARTATMMDDGLDYQFCQLPAHAIHIEHHWGFQRPNRFTRAKSLVAPPVGPQE
jgi:hypothetical protein